MSRLREDPPAGPKPLFFVASSQRDILRCPKSVRRNFGRALRDAQAGGRHADSKPLKGFGGAGVLEVSDTDSTGTYRAVYTVRFERAVYVLHVFQKKSKSGVATPTEEMDRVRNRLRQAEADYAENFPEES